MEKFTIKVTDSGIAVIGERGDRLEFSPGEALMLLDILKNEEVELRKMAKAASPLASWIFTWSVSMPASQNTNPFLVLANIVG